METKTKKVEKKKFTETSNGVEAKIYNIKGQESGKIKLPESVFAVSWNGDMVHQVITSLMTNAREPIAHAKTRGEVRGGGKKPWRQKGTGRARHGSTRSPIWVGGGVAHGPRNDKNYERKVNKKMKTKALFAILSRKWKDGELLFIDSFTLKSKEPKTKEAVEILASLSKIKGFERLSTKKKNAAIITISKKSPVIEKSFRNIGSVVVDEVRNLNPVDLLNHTFIVLENPEESIKFLESKLA